MMAAVDVLCDEIADHAADEHVRGKMLAARTREKSTVGRQTIDEQLGERSGVFMRNDPRDRPCGSGMFRRERCATLKKVPAAISLETAVDVPIGYLNPSTTTKLFKAASPARSPVSRQ